MSKFEFLGAAVVACVVSSGAWAEDLPQPEGTVLLTISGEITRTNMDGKAQFDLDMLRDVDATQFETDTIWTAGTVTFTGVQLDKLLEYVGAEGTEIEMIALNDYAVSVPSDDAVDGGPIIAYEMNGKTMSRRDKGPLWLVYPYASSSAYRTEVIYARSIWQLDRMNVRP
ncbi:molybdopterin-dependent oxidoreductase [Antarctobacter jejuensis]|uniref:molybdopterin-dependent oxidoreductase n=1 Tax=Antarctobacter jejuensis TaxID=1439938 RepID=UPI003FD5B9BD